MHPNLFSIGPITIHTYGIFVATGIFCGVLVAMKIAKENGISPNIISDICFWMIVSGVVGARIVYVIANIGYYIKYPIEILEIWKGGLIFCGGLISACISAIWFIKKYELDFWTIGDILGPGVALGQAIGRLGCFMAGCCYGKPTNCPWAVVFHDPHSLAPLNIPLHPTQIYHSLACLIIFMILILMKKFQTYRGQIFLWYLVLHSIQRLLIERFRGDCRPVFFGNMTITQFTSLIILITAGIFIILKKKENTQK